MNYTKPELVTETAQKWEKHHGRIFNFNGTNFRLVFSLTNTIYPTTGQSVSVSMENLGTNSQFRFTDLLELDGETQEAVFLILENHDKPKRAHWINKLKQKNEILENGLSEIKYYLNSNKFIENEYVNKKDILLRVQEILNAYHDLK